MYLVTIESGLYRSVRSVNQPPAAFGCQPPALYTQCIRTVLRTASIGLINAYFTILILDIKLSFKHLFKRLSLLLLLTPLLLSLN
jgi:hypothetical protein